MIGAVFRGHVRPYHDDRLPDALWSFGSEVDGGVGGACSDGVDNFCRSESRSFEDISIFHRGGWDMLIAIQQFTRHRLDISVAVAFQV